MSFPSVALGYTPVFLFWELDETSGTSFADASGSSRSGTGSGSFSYAQGTQFGGTAIGFTGAEQIACSSSTLSKGSSAWSFSFCFKTTATGLQQLASYGGWQIHHTDTGSFKGLQITDPTGTILYGISNGHVFWNDGNWHMFSMVRTSGSSGSTTMKYYVDGTLMVTQSGPAVLPTSGNITVSVGKCNTPGSGSVPFTGSIDAVLVPKQAVTASEWANLWNARSGLPDEYQQVIADGYVVNGYTFTLDLVCDGLVFDPNAPDDPTDNAWWAGDPIIVLQGDGSFEDWWSGDAPLVLAAPSALGTTLDLRGDGFIPHDVRADGYVVAPTTLDLVADGYVINHTSEVVGDGIVAASGGGRLKPLSPHGRRLPLAGASLPRIP